MRLKPKEVTCECGHTSVIDRDTDWCTKCCSRIFYTEKGRRYGKINTFYMYVVVGGVICFLTYVFVELILNPTLKF